MAFNLFDSKGVPVEQQRYTWRDMVGKPISKLNDDAYTRVRVILMNGIEVQALRFKAMATMMNRDLRKSIAEIKRSEHHQQTMVNWLLGPDHSPLETTIAYEQVAIEVTASIAQNEPDPYLAQTYRYGLLEDFDHLYRYSAMLDRLEGKDANNITQSYTDISPGRPTIDQHRAPVDDLRNPYDRLTASPMSKVNALTLVSGEFQTHDYYMNIGPQFADPVARQLYAEIASIEDQHVTQYASLIDPGESLMEKWLLHEATEAYNYYSCVQYESNPRLKAIWERFLEYELGHFHHVAELFKQVEGRDPAELFPSALPEPIKYESQRDFVRDTLNKELNMRSKGTNYVDKSEESQESLDYREYMNSEGVPTEIVSAGYVWTPGTELSRRMGMAA
jgi:rubrerythrin